MRGRIYHIARTKKPNIGDTVYIEDLFEYMGHDIVFPAIVLDVNENSILVQEQNEDDAIPEYLEKIQEVRVWYEIKAD